MQCQQRKRLQKPWQGWQLRVRVRQGHLFRTELVVRICQQETGLDRRHLEEEVRRHSKSCPEWAALLQPDFLELREVLGSFSNLQVSTQI